MTEPQDPKPIDYTALSDDELRRLEDEYYTTYTKFNIQQMALKILLNSLYGALGTQAFRYYDIALAESVTKSGKLSIKWIERKLNELIDRISGVKKDRVVLIDTDSVVLDLEDIVKKFCPDRTREEQLKYLDELGDRVLNPYIDKSYKELAEYMNAYQQKMHMKRENIINTMISCAAKTYVMEVWNSEGVQYTLDNPYYKIMGIRTQKRDTPKKIRDLLKQSIPIALHGTEEEYQKFIDQCKQKYMELSVEEIAIPKGVTNLTAFKKNGWEARYQTAQTPDERMVIKSKLSTTSPLYIKGTPIHVRASLIYNDLIIRHGISNRYSEIKNGEVMHFVYLREPNPIGENVVGFGEVLPKEFGLEPYVDKELMFKKSFISVAEGIIKPLGWSTERQMTLKDLFI